MGKPEIVKNPDGTGLFLIYGGKKYPLSAEQFAELNRDTRAGEFGLGRTLTQAEFDSYETNTAVPTKEQLRSESLGGPSYEAQMKGLGGVAGTAGTAGAYDAGAFINALVEPILEELGEFEQRVKDFGLEGPFAFDEALAREASKEIVDPYYDQLLNEFVSGIEMRRQQGATEEKELLGALSKSKEYESGNLRRQIENAIDSTEKGYELSGLYQSGERRSAVGKREAAGQTEMDRLAETYRQRGSDVSRQWQDELSQLGLRQQIGERELMTGRLEDISAGVEARRREAAQQTEMERLQTTALPFANRTEEALQRLLQL